MKQPEGYVTRSRTRGPVPVAFVIITIIVGSLWFVYQQGGFHFFDLGGSSVGEMVQEELLPGALLFFAQAPIVREGGSEIYGIGVHGEDGDLSDVLPITEERFISEAVIAPSRDAVLTLTNHFARDTSLVSIVSFGEENQTRTLVEALPEALLFFSDPVWAGDGQSVLFGRNTFDPAAAPADVVGKPVRQEVVHVALSSGELKVVGEGVPVGLSYDGSKTLFVDATNTLVMVGVDGVQEEIMTLDPFTHFVAKLSPDAQTLVMLRDDEVMVATVDWDAARFSSFTSSDAIYVDVVFDQYGTFLLMTPDGLLHTHFFMEGTLTVGDVFRTTPSFADGIATPLVWINSSQP